MGWINSLEAEHPGETEASKMPVTRKPQRSCSASSKLTNSRCDKQQDVWCKDGWGGGGGYKNKEKDDFKAEAASSEAGTILEQM